MIKLEPYICSIFGHKWERGEIFSDHIRLDCHRCGMIKWRPASQLEIHEREMAEMLAMSVQENLKRRYELDRPIMANGKPLPDKPE